MGGLVFSDRHGDILYFRDDVEEAEGILGWVGIFFTGRSLRSVHGVLEDLLYH